MHHVAIMKKQWGLIDKILSGEKTIESRWYQTRRVPWNTIQKGDTVFFKDSGETVTARAAVSEVMQFELKNTQHIQQIIKRYGKEICLVNKDSRTWESLPKYCILIRLTHPTRLKEPFLIHKKGYGSATAWITVSDIKKIRL